MLQSLSYATTHNHWTSAQRCSLQLNMNQPGTKGPSRTKRNTDVQYGRNRLSGSPQMPTLNYYNQNSSNARILEHTINLLYLINNLIFTNSIILFGAYWEGNSAVWRAIQHRYRLASLPRLFRKLFLYSESQLTKSIRYTFHMVLRA